MTGLRGRLALIALAILALLAGMWAGLIRMGWAWPPLQATLPMSHGPLMISGFLGTLIGLERAVALGRRWTYAAPLLTALGSLLAIVGWPGMFLGALLITLGSLVLVAVFAVVVRRQPALFTGLMALGAVAWALGNALWLTGRPIYSVVLWWAGFLVLTIVGERLELRRLVRLSNMGQVTFAGATALFLGGVLLGSIAYAAGMRLAGAGMLAQALWLLRYDMARRTVKQQGVTRFIAVSLLSGYVWLGISGLLALIYDGFMAGPIYDAILHTLFLGFVMSMIFGHAPITFPAVLKLPIAFRPAFYAHLVLLDSSLVLRIAGDLAGWPALRQWGGLLNAVAVLLFLANTLWAIRTASGYDTVTRRETVGTQKPS